MFLELLSSWDFTSNGMEVLLMVLLLMSKLVNGGEEDDKHSYIVLFYDSVPDQDEAQISATIKAVKMMQIPPNGVIDVMDPTSIRHVRKDQKNYPSITSKKGLYHILFLRPPTDNTGSDDQATSEEVQEKMHGFSEDDTKVWVKKGKTWKLVEANYTASLTTTKLEEERVETILSPLRFVRNHYLFPTLKIDLMKWFEENLLPQWATREIVLRGEYSVSYASGSTFKGDSRENMHEVT